jgi:hypothetical protein
MDGDFGPPGEVAGFGIIDHADTRDLMAAAAGHPATRWCVTVLNPDGTAAAHGCGAGTRPWGPGPMPLRGLLDFLNIRKLTPVIRGACQHAGAEHRYRPSRKLQHLVRARNATCTAPGCGRRAASCDLDHTDPTTKAAGHASAIWPRSASDNDTGRSGILKKVTQFACGAADLSADRCERPGRERPGPMHGNAHMPAVCVPHYVVTAGHPLQFSAALGQRLDDVLSRELDGHQAASPTVTAISLVSSSGTGRR